MSSWKNYAWVVGLGIGSALIGSAVGAYMDYHSPKSSEEKSKLGNVYIGFCSGFGIVGDFFAGLEKLAFGDARAKHAYIIFEDSDKKFWRIELGSASNLQTFQGCHCQELSESPENLGRPIAQLNLSAKEIQEIGQEWAQKHGYGPINRNCRTMVDYILCGDNGHRAIWLDGWKPQKCKNGWSILETIHQKAKAANN